MHAEPAISIGRRQLHASHRDPGVTHEEAGPGTTRRPQQPRNRELPRGRAVDLHERRLHRVPAGQELDPKQDGRCAHGAVPSRGNGLLPGLLWG